MGTRMVEQMSSILRESIENFTEVVHSKTRRSTETYSAIAEWAIEEIERNVYNYNNYTGTLLYKKRLYRDSIDFPLRRYHEYCIQQKHGHHYVEIGLNEKGVFEHMVPLSTIRDMIIAGTLTPIQGCNMPTCRISKENDNKLRLAGWASKTPNIYLFWQRYTSCIDAKFKTYDKKDVDTDMTLDDHFRCFG